MQTFLIVLGVLALLTVFAGWYILARFKAGIVAGAVMLLKMAVEALKQDTQADYLTDELRREIADFEADVNKLPAVSIFNKGDVAAEIAPLFERLSQIGQKLEALRPQSETPAPIDVPALPAPVDEATAAAHDATVCAFKDEFAKPGAGIADAWVEYKSGEYWLVYQLSMELANGDVTKLPSVPPEYRGLATIITWFPREDKQS